MRLTGLCGLSVCLLVAILDAQAQQLEVDCGAGDDLAQALEQAASSGLTWISVEGTCVGNFEFEPRVAIQIDGEGAILESPDDNVVLRIGGNAPVTVQGFEIRAGAIGVQAIGPGAWVTIRRCDIHGNDAGMVAVRGARMGMTFSDVHDNGRGFWCADRSRCSADFSTIRDNFSGVEVEGQSYLQSSRTEISGNRGNGVLARGRSTVDLDQATLLDNGATHLAVVERSDAVLQNGTKLGAPGDATQLALAAGSLSSAVTSRFGESVEIHGDLFLADSSYLVLDAARVTGNVEIIDFAEAKILGGAIAGTVVCESGGDAVCREGSSARFRGCAGARPGCSERPASQTRSHASFLEGIERSRGNTSGSR